MIIKATIQDYVSICRMIQNKKLNYITPALVKQDIINNRLYVLKQNNKIVCFATRIYCPDFGNYAIKRLCVPNKKNNGKGYAQQMISYLINTREKAYDLICTPWENNFAMRHMLEKNGMCLNYIFNKVWCMYKI